MGPLIFTIGGKTYCLSVSQQLTPQSEIVDPEAGYRCGLICDAGDGNGVDFILGMKWLERYYVALDTANDRIGFALTKYTDMPNPS